MGGYAFLDTQQTVLLQLDPISDGPVDNPNRLFFSWYRDV